MRLFKEKQGVIDNLILMILCFVQPLYIIMFYMEIWINLKKKILKNIMVGGN